MEDSSLEFSPKFSKPGEIRGRVVGSGEGVRGVDLRILATTCSFSVGVRAQVL